MAPIRQDGIVLFSFNACPLAAVCCKEIRSFFCDFHWTFAVTAKAPHAFVCFQD
jgi:hypothetical protein